MPSSQIAVRPNDGKCTRGQAVQTAALIDLEVEITAGKECESMSLDLGRWWHQDKVMIKVSINRLCNRWGRVPWQTWRLLSVKETEIKRLNRCWYCNQMIWTAGAMSKTRLSISWKMWGRIVRRKGVCKRFTSQARKVWHRFLWLLKLHNCQRRKSR